MNARTKKPITLHRAMIEVLSEKFPEVETSGFWKAMRSLPDAAYFSDLVANDAWWAAKVKFIPDAFAIDPVARVVTIFEVVDTNDISRSKLAQIAELGWALDEDCWSLSLIRHTLKNCEAYDVMGMSICRLADKLASEDEITRHWRMYTQDYTDARMFPDNPA